MNDSVLQNSNPLGYKICVVIPAFKVAEHIMKVIESIGPEVQNILIVDDACPERSGHKVLLENQDERVEVIFHAINQGVGGAVKTGYMRALDLDTEIVVKVDGDGQMDTSKIVELTRPINDGLADYTKGNRFYNIDQIHSMPKIRILGNLILSFFSKFSSGYWNIFDPNNGYTAISTQILKTLPLEKIDNRYFFESDMLFRLYLSRAKVVDVPMDAIYATETSNLKISTSIFEFFAKHLRNTFKRIFYIYYLRDFSLASIQLPLGLATGIFGVILGLYSWNRSVTFGIETNSGTQILVAISCLASLQLILSFADYDSRNFPETPRYKAKA